MDNLGVTAVDRAQSDRIKATRAPGRRCLISWGRVFPTLDLPPKERLTIRQNTFPFRASRPRENASGSDSLAKSAGRVSLVSPLSIRFKPNRKDLGNILMDQALSR
ncbi:Protein of unknown function [Magnetospira sp. QH-2]|nr:Protein of unknown function [Magnetospira sp. QH-2]